ncbi:MAG: response regulator transcription factor [Candidatus Marinimicrobia bacterium]|nr:response regulator transcription factor [Candidatus Neomarinimicrobiota bacterium]MCF7827553.1 response regulator transcription factor [Candidatus Neomarinimicrobiota bacterium]MCF7881585.1 response regulator transcription factor [Candidatus Neomarinimicrobiota bacterium]
MKLLLIEDNQRLVDDITEFLQENDYVMESATTYQEAEEKIHLYEYDLAIVDLGLPDGNGLDLISELKEANPETGILILTAKDSVEEKVDGLNLGADDYMTKPFHKTELNARIRSILRRNKFNNTNSLHHEKLKVDLIGVQAYWAETPLDLTRKEYDLLVYFMQNPNRVLTKESIAEHLWGDHIDQADSFDFIYNHIKNLRKKITDAGGENYIQAKYGMGYKFVTRK